MRASNPELLVFPYRFFFTALDPLKIPSGQGGNIVRGALGTILHRIACLPLCRGSLPHHEDCLYSRLFAPRLTSGPSGLVNPPRPFVLRATEMDGKVIDAGSRFHFDLHLFAPGSRAIEYFALAFAELAYDGLGPSRARIKLEGISALQAAGQISLPVYQRGEFVTAEPSPVRVLLLPGTELVHTLELQFVTPTELKHQGSLVRVPNFDVVFSNLRNRIVSLLSLYGEGAPDLDLIGMGERARAVNILEFTIDWHKAERRSSHTGQTHPLGGFTGSAMYQGALGEFVPWLLAGHWTGVGRQTVWGKGQIDVRRK
jgi:hypothetical protein